MRILLYHLENHAEKLRVLIAVLDLLDTEVLDLLFEIADDFVVEVTTGLQGQPEVENGFLNAFRSLISLVDSRGQTNLSLSD